VKTNLFSISCYQERACEGQREATGGGGWGERKPNKISFTRNWPMSPRSKPQAKTHEGKWWRLLTNRIEMIPQNYEASGRIMRSNEYSISKIWPKQWTNVGLKTVQQTCSVLDRICPVSPDISGKIARYAQSTQKLFSQLWFLSYETSNWMKFGHKGHLSTRNNFQKSFFSKSKDFPSILDELEESRFWNKWEKSTKSKRLEPWIHSKIGGRWWVSSYHPNPRKESTKNSANYKIKNRTKNIFKIHEMKNIAAQDRRWFYSNTRMYWCKSRVYKVQRLS
jgi:hypothetical protein